MEYSQAAIFSGAGLSAGLPAGLPLGWAFRDLLLDMCYEETCLISPTAADVAVFGAVKRGTYELEVILGRIAATIGAAALDVLALLDITVPNESHMLAAFALAHGGTHVTVNLDEGVELAYRLLTGSAALPSTADPVRSAALPSWQALVPANCPPLSVVASRHEFDAWGGGRSPYTLLKIHGSIRKTNNRIEIIEPVVEDELEYAGLAPARLVALDVLTRAPTVIITGYSGLDIDVYDPLIERLAGPETIWVAPEVWPQVRRDLSTLPRARIIDGRPAGLAATALRDIFEGISVPAWPEIALPGAALADKAASWAMQFRAHAPVGARAEAYAWFLADIGLYDNAHALLSDLRKSTGRRVDPRLRNRMADVLYDRQQSGDRRAAAQLWTQAIFAPSSSRAQRAYACTRLGEIGRGIAVRGPVPLRPIGLATAVLGPSAAIAMTHKSQVDDAREAARALSALSGLGLRILESLPPYLLLQARPFTRWLTEAAEAAGKRAQELAPGGNRLLFIRQQRDELALMNLLLTQRSSPPSIVADLQQIKTAYERADDIRGQGNTSCALALAAIVNRDAAAAMMHLLIAEDLYARSRPGQPPDPSGIALVTRRRSLARFYGLAV